MTIHKGVRCHGGWMIIEMMVALGILTMLVVGLAQTQYLVQKFNAIQLARMRCVAAGQAQLDSIAATGRPIADAELKRLWPGIRAVVEQFPGEEEWTGLTLVKVTTSRTAKGPEVKVQLARYLAAKEEQ